MIFHALSLVSQRINERCHHAYGKSDQYPGKETVLAVELHDFPAGRKACSHDGRCDAKHAVYHFSPPSISV
ncbi:MAG: hypothetical protein Q4G00_02430 [Clostridia bacterium]|nr:hypothetical protein [Clostridia bacterium]